MNVSVLDLSATSGKVIKFVSDKVCQSVWYRWIVFDRLFGGVVAKKYGNKEYIPLGFYVLIGRLRAAWRGQCQTVRGPSKAVHGRNPSSNIWGEPEGGLGVGKVYQKQAPLWSDNKNSLGVLLWLWEEQRQSNLWEVLVSPWRRAKNQKVAL